MAIQALPARAERAAKVRLDCFVALAPGKDGGGGAGRLYGGGTLPKGFEHLEELRSAQPYTTPSLSIRTVSLQRALPVNVGAHPSLARRTRGPRRRRKARAAWFAGPSLRAHDHQRAQGK